MFLQCVSKNWTFYNVSQRIELFTMCLKELNFLQCVSKNWTFYNVSQRIELFWILTQRIELFFLKMTQRIEPFMTQKLNLFFNDSKNFSIDFFECDSKNWTFFFWGGENSNYRTLLLLTQRIDFFSTWLTELNQFFLILQNWTLLFNMILRNWTLLLLTNMTQSVSFFFVENVSKNWTLFLSMTQRIELLFQKWLKELNFFFKMTQRIEPPFPIWLKYF